MNFKKTLSDKALLQEVQNILKSNLTDSRMLGKIQFSLVDVAMATLAMFRLKFPSLLQFELKLKHQAEIIKKNLFSLYNIFSPPSDTQMREILDQANPVDFRGVFTGLFKLLQRAKILTQFRFHNKKLLLALDGTGYFSSSKIHCSNCCEK